MMDTPTAHGTVFSPRVRLVALALALLLALVCVAVAPTPARAATTYTVNATTDSGIGSGATGDLRYAVTQANANPGSTIIFDPATNGATITVTSELDITASVTITGNGATSTLIAAAYTFPAYAFAVQSGSMMLSGVAVSGGFAAVYTQNTAGVITYDSIFSGSTYGLYATNSSFVRADRVLFQEGNGGVEAAGTVSIIVTNSTFNDASYGVSTGPSSATITVAGSTFNGNAVALYTTGATILRAANNILNASTMYNCFGTIIDGGHNVAYGVSAADTTCPATFTRNANPLLAALAANGATNGVQTYALQSGSPAIDTGSCAYTNAGGGAQTLATDARGVGRPRGTTCDIGSYEALVNPQPFVVTRAADDRNDILCNPVATGGCTLRQAVNASNATTGSGANTITFDPLTNGATTTLPNELDFTQNVTITGNGAGSTHIVRTGNGPGALVPQGSAALTLAGLSLSASGPDVSAQSSGALTITDSVLTGGDIGIDTRGSGPITVNRTLFSGLGNYVIYTESGSAVTVTNSTFTGSFGGVKTTSSGPVVIAGSTFSSNGAALARAGSGTITLVDSIVAGNTVANCAGTVTDGGANIAYGTNGNADTSCPATFTRNVNPLLAPLGVYGATNGVTTYALLPGSPAIDSGTCAYTDAGGTAQTLATDARAIARPQPTGGACDSGSFESRGFTTSLPTGDAQNATVNTAFGQPVGLTVASANNEPVAGGQVTFTIPPGGGASATFSPAGTVAFGTVNAMGVASSPVFTANGTAGPFTIPATASGIAAPAVFHETNNPPTSPQAYIVTQTTDGVNDAACLPGNCTFRQAVNASNLTLGSAANTITFDPTAFASPQTITVLSASGGALYFTHAVTIDGTGRGVTISDGNTGRLFIVNSGITLTLTGLTVANSGNVQGSGAIYNYRGATLTVTNSTFSGNTAPFGGGAIYNNGTLTVTGSTFSGNSTITNAGGAIFNNLFGTLTVTDSTFSGNTTATSSAGGGGAIYNDTGGTLTVTGSTFSGNAATHRSGGAIVNGGTLTLTLSVVAGNTAGAQGPDINGTVTTDGGGNVIGNTAGSTGLGAASDRLNVSALLGPLAGNGGPTQTFALLPGSPAIDIAACPAGLSTDQRGISRPQPTGGNCDSGSFESQGFAVAANTGGGQAAAVTTAFAAPVTLTLASAHSEPVVGGQVTFTITPGMGGASATFPAAGSCTLTSGTVAVCPLGTNGITTSPGFTANASPGLLTITASASGSPPTTYSETVTPAPATHFIVSGFPSPVTSGVAGTVTVTAKDASGNTATGYTGTVHLTSSDAAALLPANATLTNGVGSFTVTLKTAATQSITATDTVTNTITGAQTGIVVTPGAAASFTVSGFPSPVTSGTAGSVTVTAKDAGGNTATGYSGMVRITSSDPAALLPPNATLTNGVGSFPLTLRTAGTQSITATDTVTSSITGTQTGIVVNPGPAVSFTVVGFPSPIVAGTAGSVTVTAKDASGNIATGYSGTVHLTSSDAAALLPPNATLTNGVGSFPLTLRTAGTQSITATDTTTASITGAQAGITVTAATVKTLTTAAPTGTSSGNGGTASAPTMRVGATLTLSTTAIYSNGTSGTAAGVTYSGYDPTKISVDANGVLTAIAAGSTTITVTAPDGKGGTVTTTITVMVTGGGGGGLTNPNPQPAVKANATVLPNATVAVQPTRKADASPAGGVQPQSVGQPTATPQGQPGRH